MEWYQILSFVISLTGIGGVVGGLISSNINKRKKLREKGEQLETDENIKKVFKEELSTFLKEVKQDNNQIREELSALNNRIDALDNKLDPVCDGTMSTLRDSILSCYYKCAEKGYRNDYDYENIHHMFDAYHELKGNSFVEDIIARFDRLPVKEETVPTKVIQRKTRKTTDTDLVVCGE